MLILLAWSTGVLLGWAVAAPLGPINVEIIRRHFQHGPRAGLLLGLGACSVDTVYILLISGGLLTLRPGPSATAWMQLGSAAILVALAMLILRGARKAATSASVLDAGGGQSTGSPLRHYTVGLLMTASSPMNLVFWIGIIVGGEHSVSNPWGPWPIIVGVMCGTVSWVFGLSLLLLAGRRWLRPSVLVGLNVAGALILIALALRSGWHFATAVMMGS
jgi:threonine/homoserine/homoserine lactone efflux protein